MRELVARGLERIEAQAIDAERTRRYFLIAHFISGLGWAYFATLSCDPCQIEQPNDCQGVHGFAIFLRQRALDFFLNDAAERARAHGCDHTINYSHEDVAARVKELTGGRGVDVVFDSVGKTTFMASLDSLKRRGLMVCVGTASGPIDGFNPNLLAMKGSLYLTRPALADYIADPAEKAELAAEVFGHVAAGRIRIDIHQRYALGDAQQAHRDLESRKTTGSSIFVI